MIFDSRRRSQDIDLDYLGTAFWRAEERIDAVLASRAFTDILRLQGVELVDLAKTKQPDTTRRWKFAVQGGGARLNSKIELSARGNTDPEVGFDVARSDIGRAAGLRAVRANHYLAPAATRQKIHVLAERRETEPRDVFDLDLLLSAHPGAVRPGDVAPELARKAVDAAFTIPFDAYEQLVVDHLEDEFVEIYDRREVWDEMVTRVAEFLETLR
ncbi:MAG TPA: nucleotidyl transferase AbiEii/AbiGii toxin family protein [Thermoleophilia bacterium]|nr:nucleotidyl transferase AbiEii/AbiGii toxin family protein [Thermoleophilia bacterium]